MSGQRAAWCSTRCLHCGHGASALNLATVGHWSYTLVPCGIRRLGVLGSWWHEKHRIGASPARAALIRERAAQSADHLAEKRQKWAVVGEVVCDLGKSRNTANTTTYNSDFPAPHSRQVTTPATRYVHPPRWPQPTKTPTFPHQQAKKSPFQQHVVSYHPNFHPSQINAAIPTLSCHNSTRTTGELRATLLGNHANAALRTALRTDRPKNGPSTV